MTSSDLPTLNALLNATATVCLFMGWVSIKRRRDQVLHRRWMVAALIASAVFLCSYLLYHLTQPPTRYAGEGVLRVVYFFILATHVPLAALMVPFILAAVGFALRGRFDRHVQLVRWVWPVWMYVSVTGVAIYLMLYVL